MATATFLSPMQERTVTLEPDPLQFAAEIADVLDLLQQCRARGVSPGEEFLRYVDTLMDEIDLLEVHAA